MIFTPLVPRRARHSYRWDARSAWLFGLYSGLTAPFFLFIARQMGAGPFELEMLVASTAIGNLLALFSTCLMTDRAKMPYIFWFTTVARGTLLLTVFATTREAFVWVIFANQLLSSLSGPAYASIMKDAYPDNTRGQVMGMVRIGATVAAMTAGLYAGHLMHGGLPAWWIAVFAVFLAAMLAYDQRKPVWRLLAPALVLAAASATILCLATPAANPLPYLPSALQGTMPTVSYRFVFPVAGLLGILSMWAFSHLRERQREAAASSAGMAEAVCVYGRNLGAMFRVPWLDRRFGLYCLAFLVFGFGNWLRGPLVPMLQWDELHIDKGLVGTLSMVGAGLSLLAYVVWGRMLDRLNPFTVLIVAFLLQGLVPLCQYLTYAGPTAVPLLYAAAIIQGIVGPGVELGSLNAILHFARGEQIPVYMALHSFLVGIRGIIAPFLGTEVMLRAFAHTGNALHLSFLVSAIIVFVGFVMMLVVVRVAIRPDAAREAAEPAVPA
jgi:MFS family permease